MWKFLKDIILVDLAEREILLLESDLMKQCIQLDDQQKSFLMENLGRLKEQAV